MIPPMRAIIQRIVFSHAVKGVALRNDTSLQGATRSNLVLDPHL
jgi:hypothetical protein